MTLEKCIQWLALKHGSLRAVSRKTGVDVAYLSRLMSGEKSHPSDDILSMLGVSRKVEYKLEE